MKRFIDTNLFLRYFTNDDEIKARQVLHLLQKVQRGEEQLITSPLVIFETIFTLEKFYKVPKAEIRELMLPILALKGLDVPFKQIYQPAFELYIQHSISYTDAFNVAFMLDKDIKEIYSYDKDFDKIKEIKRIFPVL
ncbi:MAG: PIN domain-containing protein [Candidatus Schekmanbacteria bacterium]|nr:PIN domain-containing protein [Candidatus Schekmanbacteria bacterium]